MTAPGTTAQDKSAVPAGVALAVVAGATAYDMFEVVALDNGGARVRAPVLLEISEEVPLRVTRDGASIEVRARVAGHERSDNGAVTQLVFIDGASELRRLLGS